MTTEEWKEVKDNLLEHRSGLWKIEGIGFNEVWLVQKKADGWSVHSGHESFSEAMEMYVRIQKQIKSNQKEPQ